MALALGLGAAQAARAFTYARDGAGTYWGIQDASPPGVDTGSIRATQTGAGLRAPYSTTLNGYGGLRVRIVAPPGAAPRMNGELMRGFGLVFNGSDRFTSTKAVALGPATITRTIWINQKANWGRWLDTLTNKTANAITVEAAFGGQTGIGATGPGSSHAEGTIGSEDAWALFTTPPGARGGFGGGPQATVAGRFSILGDWRNDPFADPYQPGGDAGNYPAFVNRMRIPAHASRSLLHFVVLGDRVTAATAAEVEARIGDAAKRLAVAPDLSALSAAEICSVENFRLPCPAGAPRRVPQPAAPPAPPSTTSVRYNVLEKTIEQLQHDMETGATTSQAITQAYLERIAAYDRGPFGLHSFEVVASNALQQATAADAERRAGRRGPLLGIPVAIKNLYDTFDMPTTNGSLTFAGFRPAHDAFQVARLRAAGAVILGKAAMEEYATSGFYSNDAWGQVWNVYSPSRSALGSSGGSAVAVAASLAAVALGTQTGDSLYAPASAESLFTLRPTDGVESGTGIMPLVWLTDTGGVLARSAADLAAVLNVVAGADPDDPATADDAAHLPSDWRTALSADALRGKRIGIIESAWKDPFATTETIAAERAALRYFTEAGATLVPMGASVGGSDTPARVTGAAGGDITAEGWMQYLDRHPELAAQGFPIHTAVDVSCSQKKIAYSRLDPSACTEPPPPRMSAAEITAARDTRRKRQAAVAAWLDAAGADHKGVDAVVYPGLLSEISLNDGGGARASFGRRDTPSALNGVPTMVFPAGGDARGNPVDIQLLGRAWDDAKLLGMAYAFERLAGPAGHGHLPPATVPALRYSAGRR